MDNVNSGLRYACRRGHIDLVQLMIDKGATIWNLGLEEACWGGHLDPAKLMIVKGATNWDRGLSEACKMRHLDLVQLMIEKGATNLKKYFSYPKHEKKIMQLLEMGVDFKKLMTIKNIEQLERKLKEKKFVIFDLLNDYLIKDLVHIINNSFIC